MSSCVICIVINCPCEMFITVLCAFYIMSENDNLSKYNIIH